MLNAYSQKLMGKLRELTLYFKTKHLELQNDPEPRVLESPQQTRGENVAVWFFVGL